MNERKSIYSQMYRTDAARAYYEAADELWNSVPPSDGSGILKHNEEFQPSAMYNKAAVEFFYELSNSIKSVIDDLGGFVKEADGMYLKLTKTGMIECDASDQDAISDFEHRIALMMMHSPSRDEVSCSKGTRDTFEYRMIRSALDKHKREQREQYDFD